MKFSKKNFKEFRTKFNSSKDIIKSDFSTEKYKYSMIYQEILSDAKKISKDYIPLIDSYNISDLDIMFPGIFVKAAENDIKNLSKLLFEGVILLYDNTNSTLYLVHLESVPKRALQDALGSNSSLTGSRDGFIESSKVNISLIRNRLKTDDLKSEEFIVGKVSKTSVYLLYLGKIMNEKTLKIVREKITNIDIDAVTSIRTLKERFSHNIILPTVSYTGRVEYATSSMLKGRCIVFIDGFPVVIILPVNATFFIAAADEESMPKYSTILTRSFAILALFISIYFLGFAVAIILHHQKNISLLFLSSIRFNRQGVPFSFAFEVIMILLLFEIYNFTANRAPQILTQSIMVIVGGIIIGQATVTSGLASVVTLVLVAIPFISGFVVSNDELYLNSIIIQRFFILLLSAFLGLFGFFIGMILIIVYAYNTKSINTHYLAPFAPFNFRDIIRFFIPKSTKTITKRPELTNPKDETYVGDDDA